MYLVERPALPDRPGSGIRRGSRVAGTVVLLGLVSMFTDISSESVNAILPLYLTAVVGLGPLAYGFVDGIYQGVSALVRIGGGWLADRSDRPKWVAFLGYAMSAVTRIALIPAASFGAITAWITVDRLGKGIRTGPRDAMITAFTPPDRLGRAFGVHRALDTLGAVIGPIIAFAVLDAVVGGARTAADFRPVFVVSFAAAVIGLALLLLVIPDVRPRRAERLGTAAVMPRTRVLADRRFLLLLAAAGVLGILTVGDGFIYLALQRRDDLAIDYFPLLYVGTNLAYFVLAVPFGRLADRAGRARTFLLGHSALPVVYLLAGGPFSGPVVVLAALFLLGAYYAATDGTLAALAGRIVDPAVRAGGISTAQTVQALARFASSLAFGLAWELFGARAAFFAAGSALVVVVASAWFCVGHIDLARPSEVR